MEVQIRKAYPEESAILTDISFSSKRYWNYPEEYFEVWKDELTITPEYILKNHVKLAEYKGANGKILGYYSIVKNDNDFWVGKVFVMKGYWLEHIFIRPEFIGKGIGTQLIKDLIKTGKELEIEKVYIFSDPYAKGFYDKIGADYIKESPSSIDGRTVSLYELKIK